MLISHLPNSEYWRDSLWRYGQWPLWNAQLFGGQPFAADPLAGVWYPPNWLLLITPLPFGFNLLLALHLAWAGYGLFRFLQAEGLATAPAFFGGLAFAFTPKLIAHLGAGHVSLVFAVAWTPWLLSSLRAVSVLGGLRAGAIAGAALAVIFLADPRWAFYAGVLGAAYWLAYRPQRSAPLAAVGFVAALLTLSAPLALPLLDFVTRTDRSALTLAEAASYSLPVWYLLGLLIPPLRGFHEWMTFLGVAPLLLAVLAIAFAARRLWFWIATTLVAGAFSLGSNFVLFPLLFGVLPGLSLLRVPSRAWFIVALAVAVLAAHGLQLLMEVVLPQLRARSTLARRLPSARLIALALIALTALDLWRVNVTLVEARPRPARNAAAAWIAAQTGLFRVYSPSYSLPLDDGLQHVDGVNPLHLAAAARFIERAGGVPRAGYSVTLPPFASDDYATANANAMPDARLLGLLNVRYVAAEFDLDAPGLTLVQRFGATRVYENREFRPRAWLESGARAELVAWSPNRIVVRAEGPGRLVLSEVDDPGWEAYANGVALTIEPFEDLLRSVTIGTGEQEVVFEYRPRPVYAGLALALPGLVGLVVLWRRR
ncbi:MAG: hypothetical protein RMK99_14585 [Anaerolineales bacterium]|nr:hypothetical protein [Anaerolineales bacterium]